MCKAGHFLDLLLRDLHNVHGYFVDASPDNSIVASATAVLHYCDCRNANEVDNLGVWL